MCRNLFWKRDDASREPRSSGFMKWRSVSYCMHRAFCRMFDERHNPLLTLLYVLPQFEKKISKSSKNIPKPGTKSTTFWKKRKQLWNLTVKDLWHAALYDAKIHVGTQHKWIRHYVIRKYFGDSKHHLTQSACWRNQILTQIGHAHILADTHSTQILWTLSTPADSWGHLSQNAHSLSHQISFSECFRKSAWVCACVRCNFFFSDSRLFEDVTKKHPKIRTEKYSTNCRDLGRSKNRQNIPKSSRITPNCRRCQNRRFQD